VSQAARPPDQPAQALLASINDESQRQRARQSERPPARFALLTQKGQTASNGAPGIRDEREIGLVVDVVPLEGNALVQRFLSGQPYDAVAQFGIPTPIGVEPGFLAESGTSRVWNLAQKTRRRTGSADRQRWRDKAADVERKRLFDQVQRVFAEHLPVVHSSRRILYRLERRRSRACDTRANLWAAEIAVKP
jgi:hypothetical protein